MMKKHGLRRFFSLLLAVFMVCTLLPTAALAEDTTGDGETQTVVVDEKKPTPPAQEQPKGENLPAQEQPKGENPPAQEPPKNENPPAPEQGKDKKPDLEEDKIVADDNTGDNKVAAFVQSARSEMVTSAAANSATVTFRVSSLGAPFRNGSTGEHTVPSINFSKVVNKSEVGADNASGTASAKFSGSNEGGWQLVIVLDIGNLHGEYPQNAYVFNKDMSEATGRIDYGVSFNQTNPGIGTTLSIKGAKPLPSTKPDKPSETAVKNLLNGDVVKVQCTNTDANHSNQTKQYPLLDNSFTVGDVQGSSGNYTCVVTVHADQHVTAYGNGHTLASANESPKTIMLKYNETAKKWERPSSLPITFNVACDNAVPPVAPSEAEVAAMDIWVTVSCTKNPANHSDRMSRLTVESIVRIGDVQTNPVSGEYTCTVEVNSSDYVTQFDKTHGYAVHRPTGKSGYIDLTYSKEANRWVAPASPYNVITFQVKCVTSPTFNDLKTIFNQNIHVDCTTESMHTEALYDLIENSYVIDDYTTATYNPTCTVIIRPRLYVEEYNTSFGAHATDSEGESIALYYADNGWTAADGALPVVFKVKCNTEIVPPPKPDDEKLGELDAPVKVVCTTKPETHAAAHFSLRAGTYTIGNVVGNETDGYTCDVTVTADRYVTWYNLDYGKHTLTGDNTKTLTLKYVEGQWAVDTPVTFTVICPPAKPGAKDLAKLEAAVEVVCTTKPETHATAHFSLGGGPYTIGDVAGNETDGYTCDITVTADRYVTWYNLDYGKHTLTGDNTKTLTLKYVEGQWAVDTPVTFRVECGTTPQKPKMPALDDLRKLLGQVTVDCTTNDKHPDGKYDLIEDSYIANIEDQNGTYVCMVSVYADKYVAKYNETYSGHSLAGSANSDKVKLVYLRATKTDTGYTPWRVSEAEPLTFAVKCSTEIDPSKKPAPEQLPKISVTLHCGTTSAHQDSTWSPLLENTYEISTPALKDDVYTCTLTVKAETYVKEFSGIMMGVGKHELDDDATKDITLTWDGQKWTAETSSVTFKVKCSLYTVIYTDGVKNKVIFKDELHENLAYGSDTPKFTGGTPKRTGYTFTGWSPKVADTVTGNVTYKAQWKSNSGKDNVPKTGDGQIVMILGSVLLFSFCGATAVYLNDRKRKQG